MEDRKPSILLVDGYSLIYRGFHALPLLSSGGVYTNAMQGFFSMLFKALGDFQPDYLCVMLDMKAPTFRHTLYADYKATRKPTPEELKTQIPLIRDVLSAMEVSTAEVEGYEADDLLGTAAYQAEAMGMRVYILTGDRDSLQLVGGERYVILTKTGITENLLLDAGKVKGIYGYTPEQVTDIKGLMGDSSDNIPGIPGVGEKTALKLIGQYGTLESVLDHAEEVPGKLGEKLRNGREIAEMSRDLGTIRVNAPLNIHFEACTWSHLIKGLPELEKYRLNRLAQTLKALMGVAGDGQKDKAPETLDGPENLPCQSVLPAATMGASKQTLSPLNEQGTLLDTMAIAGLAQAAVKEDWVALLLRESVPGPEFTLCLPGGRLWRIPLALDLTMGGLYEDQILKALSALWGGSKTILHGAKTFLGKLKGYGCPVPNVLHDTMLGAYLLHATQKNFALDACLAEEFDNEIYSVPTAWDVYALSLRQREVLFGQNMLELLMDMEQPLTRVLMDMEREGFGVNRDTIHELGRQFTTEIEDLRQEVYRFTGIPGFNLNSPKQLGEVLFDKLKLPTGKKGKAGAYSTDAVVLEGLAEYHPSIDPLLRYRKLTKLQGTYIEGLLRLIDPTGRIHTTFDQTATLTGRISSLEPNLQNIPVRSEEGREIRKAFVARDGYLLLDADYSQIELRVLAHLSGDPAMKDAFLKEQDIHTRTAAEIHGIPLSDVTPALRRSAKAVNFGIVYGISGFGLARNIGISRKEADSFINAYFERYPKVKAFMDETVRMGHSLGYVETLFHRRRYLPELINSNRNIRAFGERAAMNTPVQGTAADIIKLAMVRVAQTMQKGGFTAKLILQVHDELVVECPFAEVESVSRLIKETMENVVQLDVPLVAEVSSGKSWFDAH